MLRQLIEHCEVCKVSLEIRQLIYLQSFVYNSNISPSDIFCMEERSRLSLAMRSDLGLEHNENYFLDFLRLSIVIWPHATSSSIETVCAKWRILAYITIILNMDMAMLKR